jgi:hypothetical protein
MATLKSILSGRSAKIVLWVIVWLALLDVGVNFAFGSRKAADTTLGKYFEYGRSVEGKLERIMAGDPTRAMIIKAGWIEPHLLQALPAQRKEGTDLLVAAYGQSFTMQASNLAAEIDGHITLRPFGGPGAPPNHSYAGYKADEPLRKVDVVVFGVLSASVPDMGSMTGLLWHFENPAPFTFPRYRVVGSELTEELPVIRSEAQFREAFSQKSGGTWAQFRAQLQKSDRGFDRFTFDQSAADHSSVLRLVRRGWVAHNDAYDAGVYDSHKGFNPESEDVKALKAMLIDLSRRTQARGERFIVLLLHTRGQSDHLNKALEATLKASNIDYISTHTLFSANDPTNFLPDSHYVPAANRKLATVLAAHIRQGASAPR